MVKKRILTILLAISQPLLAFPGGLVTNTMQSAQFVRMPSRNASVQEDAVYFNPAGLVSLEEGWYFSVYNLASIQELSLFSSYPLLNQGDYIGERKNLILPGAYAVYRMKRWAFSLGFGSTAGEGSSTYVRGIASREIGVSKLKNLQDLGITGYTSTQTLKTRSYFPGVQAGASFSLSDRLSVYGGIRFISCSRSYLGGINDVQLEIGNSYFPAAAYLAAEGTKLKNEGMNASSVEAKLNRDFIDKGASYISLATLYENGIITLDEKNELLNGLIDLNYPSANDSWYMVKIRDTYHKEADARYEKGTQFIKTGSELQDSETDNKQTGIGITPVAGIHFSPSEDLNITAKYEYKTRIEVTNRTKGHDLNFFEDGEKQYVSVPGLFAAGIGFRPEEPLEIQLSYNLYFDKDVSWGYNFRESALGRSVKRKVRDNTFELALGLQYSLNESFAISMGGMISQTGVEDNWQSDFSYASPSVTFGGGIEWKLNDQLTLDAGFMKTSFKEITVSYEDASLPGGVFSDILGRSSAGFALGFSYRILK